MGRPGIADGTGRLPGTRCRVERAGAFARRIVVALAAVSTLGAAATAQTGGPDAVPAARELERRLQRLVDPTMPAGAPAILSEFLSMRGVSGRGRDFQHNGIDVDGAWGDPVIAAAAGIAYIWVSNWGITAVVTHDAPLMVPAEDGAAEPIKLSVRTYYGHLSETAIPREGRHRVARGQVIGSVGRTGIASGDTAHVHFMVGPVRRQTEPLTLIGVINPHLLWADGEGRVTCFDPKRRYPRDRLVLTYPVPCAAPAR